MVAIEVEEYCEECGKTNSFLLTPKYILVSKKASMEYLIEEACKECGLENSWFGEFQREWVG
jgi:hypothetical protein